ncbi:unnamed protein product [Prorocentrum cordatum]|uniref:Uncharacterized protein n=1 Tax=Prorocentrum cordatum TaxID=2364126 RepID=A0ABN9WJI6_9DINO|nr:unnamed protein product [Polarella glacialis]
MTIDSHVWNCLRIIYAAVEQTFTVTVDGDAACDLQLLAKDGIYLNEIPIAIHTIYLYPGSRADVVMSCACARVRAGFSHRRMVRARVAKDQGMMGYILLTGTEGAVFADAKAVTRKSYEGQEVTNLLVDSIQKRAKDGKNYGVVVLPEGLIEFIPEFNKMIGEINELGDGLKEEDSCGPAFWSAQYLLRFQLH